MAFPASLVFELESGGSDTANGGGFDPSNNHMATDGAATVATSSSPIFSSASYTFVSGDVGNWVFIKSGTNWTPGWYKISSVSSGKATLNAGVGTALSTAYALNTVAGCATTASPTSASWTVDYSQTTSPTAANTLTGLTSTGAGLVVLCTTSTKAMIGNNINITGGTNFNPGIYNVSNVSAGVNMTLVGAGNSDSGAGASGTANVGGCFGTWNGLLSNISTAGQMSFVKSGTIYPVTSSPGSVILTHAISGYTSIRGDRGQPTVQIQAASVTIYPVTGNIPTSFENLIFDGNSQTSSVMFNSSTPAITFSNCSFLNFTGAAVTSASISANGINGSGNSGAIFTSTGASTPTVVSNSYFNNNSGAIITTSSSTPLLIFINSVVGNQNTTTAVTISASQVALIQNVSFHGKSGSNPTNFILESGASGVIVLIGHFFNNLIFENCSGAVITSSGATFRNEIMSNCATYNVGSISNNTTTQIINAVSLTGDAFNNASGGDFSLNNTAGAGAACLQAGVPGVFPGGLTTGYNSIGAAQPNASGSSGHPSLIHKHNRMLPTP